MEELIKFLINNGKAWVKSQRESHRPNAEPLPTAARERLAPYFCHDTLASIRVRQVEQIENPEFYEMFEQAGQPIPLDFRAMEGITFIDTIVIAKFRTVSRDWTSLLFHECVHALQYQVLGLDRFIEECPWLGAEWIRLLFNSTGKTSL